MGSEHGYIVSHCHVGREEVAGGVGVLVDREWKGCLDGGVVLGELPASHAAVGEGVLPESSVCHVSGGVVEVRGELTLDDDREERHVGGKDDLGGSSANRSKQVRQCCIQDLT